MIRMAIIGCGGMSGGHRAALERLSGRVAVTAVVDVDDERLMAASEQFPDAKAVKDYRAILDEVDAVNLVLPHHLHHPIGMACLDAGKHVLLEKPMANSEQECLDLIAASEKSGRVFMIAYCMRYHPLVVRMKEMLDAKVCGDVFQVSIWTEQHTQYAPDHWASSAVKLGGGQFFSHGCHYVDILLWYLGRPVRGTHLGTDYGTPWMEKEGTSNVALEFESGALGYHFGTWGAKGSRLKYSFHAHCTDGMIEAAISDGKLIVHKDDEEEVVMDVEPGKHVGNEITHFLDCIENGAEPFTNARDSLEGLRVIWRLYDAEQRNVVADLRGLGLEEGK